MSGSGWVLEKYSSSESGWALEQSAQFCGHGTELDRVQEMFGQRPQTHFLIVG